MIKTRFGLQHLTDLVGSISRPFMHKHSLLDERVFKFWQEIVGPKMAQHTMPLRLLGQNDPQKHGVRQLEILVTPGAAMELSYMKSQLIEKINRFYGYAFVVDLRIKQGKIPVVIKRSMPKQQEPLVQTEDEWVEKQTEGIHDHELRDIMKKLGQHVLRDQKRKG